MPKTITIDARIINSTTGRYVERLLHHLEQIDTTNTYIVLVPTKDLAFYTPTNPNFRVQAADFANYSFAEQTPFKQFLEALGADLVHFCMPQQPIGYRGAHVTTIHDLILLRAYNSDKNWFTYHAKQLVGRFVFKTVARRSAHILTPTHYVKNEFAAFAGINPDKITVTYEGCDIGDITPKAYKPLVDASFITYVGQQSDYKNIKRLMQAHQKIRKTKIELQLVLIGSLSGKNGEPLRRNKAWAERQGYQGIIYTDFLPDDQMRWCLAHAEAYVFPSLMEGFGLPALEAMASGAPVVASNATCIPEVCGDAAEYFDPTNTDDMAAAILRVITNPARRKELIDRGVAQVQRYSWRRMAEQTHAVYMDALTG
jgi:glycosyltransferase involved in cell wall biosynthesis